MDGNIISFIVIFKNLEVELYCREENVFTLLFQILLASLLTKVAWNRLEKQI